MQLNYKKAQSDTRPAEIDAESSPTTVYIRRSIEERTRTPEAGESETYYTYEEAAVPRTEYDSYMIEKNKADIEYLYMMGDLDYE